MVLRANYKEEKAMAKITFWTVLKSNLKCAVCKNKNCTVRYYPERKRYQWCDGKKYYITCEKDKEDYIEKSLKRPLP